MNSIWIRYTLRELSKVFFLFLGVFYFLYVLIDYSAHAKAFQGAGFFNGLLYYLFQFTQRAEILIPIGLMLAGIKVMTTLNNHNELVAMVSGGVAMKRLLRPFFLVAFLTMTFLYMNFQYLQPKALTFLSTFEKEFFQPGLQQQMQVHSLSFPDHSKLIYSHYDPLQEAFIEAYWLPKDDEIYYSEYFFPFGDHPTGKEVDHLIRDHEGRIQLVAHFPEKAFPTLHFDHNLIEEDLPPPKWQPLSSLLPSLPLAWKGHRLHDQDADCVTTLLYKLLLPLTCVLVILAPAPHCLRFGRHLPIFLIYALSLFGLITFLTLVNSSVILAKSQVIPPLWAMSTVFFLPLLFFGYRYAKL